MRLDHKERAPVLMHCLFDSAEDARACPVAEITLCRCEDCGFAWNAAFDPAKIDYGPDYDNAQGHSAEFRAHIDARIDAIFAATTPDARLVIVEVGCGQGDFLGRIMARHGGRVEKAFGFDPAWRGEDGDGPAGAQLYRRYFDAGASAVMAGFSPDIVISRHTIEHIADPMAFLGAIRAGIGTREGGRLFLETPDIEWIVQQQAFEDVFYEHCSIFDVPSLAQALVQAGFADASVATCFGAQYLWAEACVRAESAVLPPEPRRIPAQTVGTAALVSEWTARIDALRLRGGRFAVWGAGAKGMTFAQIVDPEQERIVALIDVNPGKQGRHIGLSGHKVVAPDAVTSLGLTDILVMNPVYTDEIGKIIRQQGVMAALHSLHEEHP